MLFFFSFFIFVQLCFWFFVVKLFEALGKREGFPELELISKIKGDDSYIKDIVAALVSGSAEVAKVGLLVKDLQEGAFAESIMDALNKNSLLSIEDISSGISDLLASKDAFGIEQSRKAATASSVILKDFLQNRIEDIIADDKSVTHSQLSEEVDKIFGSPDELVKLFSKHPEISYDELDTCYSPIIQSGGKYDLKPSASSNDDALHSGVIIAEVGIRYASYCSNIIRTMFINADESQQRTYKLLLKVYMACVSTLKDGARVSDVYKSAIKVIRAREPSLEEKFTKNCGFLTGLDFRDSSYVLNGTNNRKIRVGMVFNLIIGFEDLEKPRVRDPRGKNYAILVGDTVLVTSKGCEHLTSGELNFKEVSYQMDEEGDEDAGFLETGAGIPLSFAGDEIGPRTRASRNKKNNDEEYLLQQNVCLFFNSRFFAYSLKCFYFSA